ncbi:MAG: CoA transferase subunit A [Syntrophomonadaceae bacterium]|jgi:acetate CoA/acetoacetate CoA-transferase alpha subunit
MPIITNALDAIKDIEDGSILMFGGFMACGTPPSIIDALITKGVKNLTVICNDTGFIDIGVGKLICQHRVAKLFASHIGTNPETGRQINSGELDAVLIPQGTLVERIRTAGAGLGGFLTPTGLGTIAEEEKSILIVEGKRYILELPLRADFALLHAKTADKAGNLIYHGTMSSFNPVMALAADKVIAEVDEIIENGFLNPDNIHTPGILVDYLVKGGN